MAGTELAVAQLKGKVYALHNLCTHLACHLPAGRDQERRMHCLCRGSVFDPATDEPTNPPATRPAKTYPVRKEDGYNYIAVK